jgi:hypothetical protein
LRYSILDGSRLSSQVSRGQVQIIRQNASGLARITAALLSSPLSLAQRRLASSLHSSLEAWMKDQSDEISQTPLPVGAPVLQAAEFSPAEVIYGAVQAVQQAAAAAGTEIQTAIAGTLPARLAGCAGHLCQLITLLPESLLRLPGIRRIGLQISVASKLPGMAELNVQLLLLVNDKARELGHRLAAIAEASGTLQTAHLGESELGLAACWQLAHALGGSIHFDTSAETELSLRLVIPAEVSASGGTLAPAAGSIGAETPELVGDV